LKKLIISILFTSYLLASYAQNPEMKFYIKKPDSSKVKALILLADKAFYFDIHLSKQYTDSALKISQLIYYKQGIASSYNMFGHICAKEIDYESAIQNYNKAFNIWQVLNDSISIAGYYANIAAIHSILKKNDLSLEYYNKALYIFNKKKDEYHIAQCNNSIGSMYFSQTKYDSALVYFKKVLSLDTSKITDSLQKTEINMKLAMANGNIANVFSNKEKYEKAIDYYFESMKEFEKAGNRTYMSLCYNNIAVASRRKKDFSSAIKYSKKSMEIAKEIESLNIQKLSFKNLAKTYALTNKYKIAYENYLNYKLLSDSMYDSKTSNKVSKLIRKHEIEQKEKEQNILINDNKIKELKIKKRNSQIGFLIILTFVFFLALVVFIVAVVKIKNRNSDLIKRNIEIVESEQELYMVKAELEVVVNQKMNIKELETLKNEQNAKKELSETLNKYSGSALDIQQQELLKNAIIQIVEKDKIYLQTDLTLSKLANQLGTNYSYVSQIINQDFNKNFSNYINEYRIKEARRLLVNTDTNLYSMEYISESVGFKSISSFNRAFKKFTGIPPTAFLNNQTSIIQGKKL